MMHQGFAIGAVGAAALAVGAGTLLAEATPIPNASFESPLTEGVDINFDSWQKSPKPAWYDEGGGFYWHQLIGAFKNTAPGSFDHIDNLDGNQAIWLFAVPEVGLFQDYDSVDWNDMSPTHDFAATFEVGKSYELTVGVIGLGGGMLPGVTMEMSLYYRDAASNLVTVAAAAITNSPDTFSNRTHFIDFQVNVPEVRPADPWAGQHLGVRFLSTVSFELQGGYWDLDNVRLVAASEPTLATPTWSEGQFTFTVESEPGLTFEMLAATNPVLPLAQWTPLGTLTNVTGHASFSDPATNGVRRFYRARQMP